MKRDRLHAIPLLIVRAAGQLVPGGEKAGWMAEWRAELWHLVHGEDSEAGGSGTAIACSLGAIPDAIWLRWDATRTGAAIRLRRGSAARCTLILGLMLAGGLLACELLPGSRSIFSPFPWRAADDLVTISSRGFSGTKQASIPLADYRAWTTDTANLYTGVAFYRPMEARVYVKHHRSVMLPVAICSDNLLAVLGAGRDGQSSRAGESGRARLFLTRSAWRRDYGGDAGVFGKTADVAGQPTTIAGIVPNTAWRLPGHVDGWLLEDAHGLATQPAATRGFAIARIRQGAFPPARAGWRWMVETHDGVTAWYACISIRTLARQPLAVFPMTLLLVLLALPAITALALGDYPLSREQMRHSADARRWAFLALKFVLVTAIVFLWTAALAYGPGWLNSMDGLIQAMTSFAALLFGYRWILQDQRRRCPVCLRLLSNPARVGQASCSFLNWCGTELICASGHGLLHIPELPTSWFRTQRWQCLDPSWLSLFTESPAPTELV
jgi:hypothetical protein